MKQLRFFSMMIIMIMSFIPYYTQANEEQLGRYIIGFHEDINEEIMDQYGGEILLRLDSIQALSVLIPTKNLNSLLHESNTISFIEKDEELSVKQEKIDWGVAKTKAPQIWNNNVTGKGVKVAVLDTGVATNHPDLQIEKGVSFVPYTSSYNDDNGHGTHVLGIIGARKNGIGVVGVAPDVQLYAVKVLDQEGNGFQSNVIKGIEWAIEQKVDIINLSVGGQEYSASLEKVIQQAYGKGILLVAAAGNKGTVSGQGDTVEYPAKFKDVIAVAAVDSRDRRATFSATGEEIEVSAPGVSIYSTYLNGGYEYSSGTSMAAPHVTGHLALLKDAKPSLTAEELRSLLQTQTIELGEQGKDRHFGYGRIELPVDLKKDPIPPTMPSNLEVQKELFANDQWKVFLSWTQPESQAIISHYEVYVNDTFNTNTSRDSVEIFPLDDGEYIFKIVAVSEEQLRSTALKSNVLSLNHRDIFSAFNDVTGSEWFAPHLLKLVEKNIITGYTDQTLRPNQYITRAEAMIMFVRALDIKERPYQNIFPDVESNMFAASFIQVANEEGIIGGFPDGTFRPKHSITRGETAELLYRAYKLSMPSRIDTFQDVTPPYFAVASINAIAEAKITTGYEDGTFKPNNPITRAEFAALLARTMNQINQE